MPGDLSWPLLRVLIEASYFFYESYLGALPSDSEAMVSLSNCSQNASESTIFSSLPKFWSTKFTEWSVEGLAFSRRRFSKRKVGLSEEGLRWRSLS